MARVVSQLKAQSGNMKKEVKRLSSYWHDFEVDTTEYIISWDTTEARNKLKTSEKEFLLKYALICLKYGIALPNFDDFNALEAKIDELIEGDKTIYPENWIPIVFNELYNRNSKFFNSSYLFIEREDSISLERIVNIELLKNLSDTKENPDYAFSNLTKITFSQNYLHIAIENDVLLTSVKNIKTSYEEIDNSRLAYLNSPRFNSFLKSLLVLSFEYGATDFSFHNYYEPFESISINPFTKDGVIFKNEVLMYEDIYESLPDNHKYKSFGTTNVTLDERNFEVYQRSCGKL